MTINEQIAAVMGWVEYFGDSKYPVITDAGHKVSFQFGENEEGEIVFDINWNYDNVKLLQQRMVDDGWWIEIHHWKEQLPDFPAKIYFSVSAMNNEIYRFADADTEPQAIVELFCKVFNIKEDK